MKAEFHDPLDNLDKIRKQIIFVALAFDNKPIESTICETGAIILLSLADQLMQTREQLASQSSRNAGGIS